MAPNNETMMFKVDKDKAEQARDIIMCVYEALNEKGYNSINQLVGYILSGDPTYITSHQSARSNIRKLERDELLEEIIRFYVQYPANQAAQDLDKDALKDTAKNKLKD